MGGVDLFGIRKRGPGDTVRFAGVAVTGEEEWDRAVGILKRCRVGVLWKFCWWVEAADGEGVLLVGFFSCLLLTEK